MAIRFYRRLQVRHVVPGFRVSLADLLIGLVLGVCAYYAAGRIEAVYAYEGIGSSWGPFLAGGYVMVLIVRWFRLEGDGIVHKRGIFRQQASSKINRVMVPDRPGSSELFIVVTSEGVRDDHNILQGLLDSLIYGLKLREKPFKHNQTPGSVFCRRLGSREQEQI
jgi:hypothetical protein